MSIYSIDNFGVDFEKTILDQLKEFYERIRIDKKIFATIAIKKLIDYLYITQKHP